MVIAARNPVHSVLFLILAFFNAAGLFVLLGRRVPGDDPGRRLCRRGRGAVPLRRHDARRRLRRAAAGHAAVPAGRRADRRSSCCSSWCSCVGTWTLRRPGAAPRRRRRPPPTRVTNTAGARPRALHASTSIYFQAAGLVLLVAMIGAIVLTLRHEPGVKRQDIAAAGRAATPETQPSRCARSRPGRASEELATA